MVMDSVDSQTRSRIMAAIRSKDTKPELLIRRALFALGHRYRLHRRDLPGTPDAVFTRHRAVLFVHGCFWHHHACLGGRLPKTRRDWWRDKLERNARRDVEALARLRAAGWRVAVVWECAWRRSGVDRAQALARAVDRVSRFLTSRRAFLEVSGPLPAPGAPLPVASAARPVAKAAEDPAPYGSVPPAKCPAERGQNRPKGAK